MNYNYSPLDSYDPSLEYTDRTVINTIRLNTGYCAELPYVKGINYYYEFNAGIGSRSYNTNINDRKMDFDDFNNPIIINNPQTFSFNKMAFIVNVKFGILF